MPVYSAREQAIVEATPDECFAEMTDYERLPQWQRAVSRCTILSRDERGRGDLVEYEIDAKVRCVRYRLRQVYDEPRMLGSEYVEGDFREMRGAWYFDEHEPGRTQVRLELEIDPGRWVPRPIARLVQRAVATRAVEDLERHMRGRSRGAAGPASSG